jgi:hypothetical protein
VLADYYARTALAAAQVLEGFDPKWFRERLAATPIGLTVTAATPEAEAIGDLGVRLLARLYPRLALIGERSDQLTALAHAINPEIEIVGEADVGIVVGDGQGEVFETCIFAGSDGWDALVADVTPQPVGESSNPIGPGVAASLAAASVFRMVFLDDWRDRAERELRFSAIAPKDSDAPFPERLVEESVLVGAGAIGNGALWALGRAGVTGTLHVVDMEAIELSNLQRYVLAARSDEGADKIDVAAQHAGSLDLRPHAVTFAEFAAAEGYAWPQMLLALDSARDRVGAQASLPRWIANAWTQPGDLGVSVHPTFGDEDACVGCLYLPDGPLKNEDELVADALRVPQLLMQVRTLLYTGKAVDRAFLEQVAVAVGQPVEALLPFEGRTIRDLYVEGFCGGAVIPLGDAGRPHMEARDVHVPLAHQSALAGVLLAGSLLWHAAASGEEARVTRIDVLRAVGVGATQPLRARRDGRCICDDPDYVSAWRAKWDGN